METNANIILEMSMGDYTKLKVILEQHYKKVQRDRERMRERRGNNCISDGANMRTKPLDIKLVNTERLMQISDYNKQLFN